MEKRIQRSRKNKMIAGVCGGLGEYFNIDPTIVRIAYVAVSLAGGPLFMMFVIAYFAAAIIVPQAQEDAFTQDAGNEPGFNPDMGAEGPGAGQDEWAYRQAAEPGKGRNVLGIILVVAGALLLMQQLFRELFDWKYVLPVLFIVFGGLIIFRGRRGSV